MRTSLLLWTLGYWQLPLEDKASREILSFLPPSGAWRYTRAPQGFVNSMQSFQEAMDTIFPRERLVFGVCRRHSDTSERCTKFGCQARLGVETDEKLELVEALAKY
eukprot:GHVP01025785.1.p1 GENE.GHVP01025785.1~~GHVP01025785.1.p1  ORF type:complete len:106 (-),score=14.31 GHVP01025785.1:448-765(-)